jgi:hypothetical protein
MADAAPGPGVDPVVDGVPIEDGSALTASVWKTLEAEGSSLGLPELKVQPLTEFLQAAELQKMTTAEKHGILDQAVLLFDHLYPHLTFKKNCSATSQTPGKILPPYLPNWTRWVKWTSIPTSALASGWSWILIPGTGYPLHGVARWPFFRSNSASGWIANATLTL